jgi:hypothetical protein
MKLFSRTVSKLFIKGTLRSASNSGVRCPGDNVEFPLNSATRVRTCSGSRSSYIATDGQPASLSWCRGPRPDLFYCPTFAVIRFWAPYLTRGRVCNLLVQFTQNNTAYKQYTNEKGRITHNKCNAQTSKGLQISGYRSRGPGFDSRHHQILH